MSQVSTFQFHLDTAGPNLTSADDYSITGWVVAPESKQAQLSLALTVDGVEYPVVYGISRPDVARSLVRSDASNCGFAVRFEIEQPNPILKLYACLLDGKQLLTDIRWNSIKQNVVTHVLHLPRPTRHKQWGEEQERLELWGLEEVPARLALLREFPLISIVVPVSGPKLQMLRHSIRSVLKQHYWNWELCIAGDFSRNEAVKTFLREVATGDSRVKLVDRPGEDRLAPLKNYALSKATGQFVSFLDQHDEIHSSVLIEVVKAINSNPGLNMIYTDEDVIDAAGVVSHVIAKPDFDVDMMRSQDYVGNLLTLRRSLCAQVGNCRSEAGSGHAWDLALRVAEQTNDLSVHHIGAPLYHARNAGLSRGPEPASASQELHENIVRDYIARQNLKATAEKGINTGSVRVKYSVPPETNVAVIVKIEDGAFQACSLQDCAARSAIRYYAQVGSVMARVEETGRERKGPLSSRDYRLRAGTCSRAVEEVTRTFIRSFLDIIGDVVIFVNGPLETVNHSFIEELTAQALRRDCGLVSGIALTVDGTILHSGLVRGRGGELVDLFAGLKYPQTEHDHEINVVRKVDGISDRFFATRREHVTAVGGLPAVCGAHLQRLVMRLLENAELKGLKVIATPYAVASFHPTGQLRMELTASRRLLNK